LYGNGRRLPLIALVALVFAASCTGTPPPTSGEDEERTVNKSTVSPKPRASGESPAPKPSPTATPERLGAESPKPSPTQQQTTQPISSATPDQGASASPPVVDASATPAIDLGPNDGVLYAETFQATVLAGGAAGLSKDGLGEAAIIAGATGAVGMAYEADATNVVFTDAAARLVRQVNKDGNVTRVAGADGSAGIQLRLLSPAGLTLDQPRKVIYFCDTGSNLIRRIYRTGNTYDATVGRVDNLAGVEIKDPPDLEYRDGLGKPDDAGAPLANFNNPSGLAVLGDKIYIADTGNHTIRMLDLNTSNRTVSFVAGGKGSKGKPPSGSAEESREDARFDGPTGLAIGGTAEKPVLYVADTNNHCIRAIDISKEDGKVTTYAGGSFTAGSNDGSLAEAGFNKPTALAIDGKGNLYVGERGNFRVRRIGAAGGVVTLSGRKKDGASTGARDAAMYGGIAGLTMSLDGDGLPASIYAYDAGLGTETSGARIVRLRK
jgi:sugar lactone lactonase YvrE